MKPNWIKRWVDLTNLVSSWSKDRSTKVGCVIVDDRNVVLSLGWNGFPRGVNDDIDKRHQRPNKYKYTEHSERNAIYNAAAKGISLFGSTMVLAWFPCSNCARAIIQSGISTLICSEPNFDDPTYGEDFTISYTMLNEAYIDIEYQSFNEINKDRKEYKNE